MMPKRAKADRTDVALLEAATSFRAGILMGRPSAGFCFMVSAPLAGLLEATGWGEMEVCESRVKLGGADTNHCWIKLPDGRVLDATADQFHARGVKLPPVYLGKPHPKLHKGAA